MRRVLLLLSPFAASCAAVQERDPELVAGWGVAGVFDERRIDGLSVEYRHYPMVWNVVPMVGFSASAVDKTAYSYAGLQYPIDLGDRWRLVPSLAAGYYDSKNGFALGGDLEFRSAMEVNYLLNDEWRLGAAFSHLSNGSLYDFNPGTEALVLSVHYLF